MTTPEERLARLEAGYEHLATKADLANLRAEMHRINSTLLKWIVGFMLTSVSTGVAAILINLLD